MVEKNDILKFLNNLKNSTFLLSINLLNEFWNVFVNFAPKIIIIVAITIIVHGGILLKKSKDDDDITGQRKNIIKIIIGVIVFILGIIVMIFIKKI